jgi:hypothetical protein
MVVGMIPAMKPLPKRARLARLVPLLAGHGPVRRNDRCSAEDGRLGHGFQAIR